MATLAEAITTAETNLATANAAFSALTAAGASGDIIDAAIDVAVKQAVLNALRDADGRKRPARIASIAETLSAIVAARTATAVAAAYATVTS